MRRLYLVRHGIAQEHGTAGVPDDERRLTPKGEQRVKQVGEALRRLAIDPDRIVTSPLPRARRTAEIIAEVLGVEHRLEDSDALAAGASDASIREWLRSRDEEILMLVGHNPSLTDLLGLLLGISALKLPFDLKTDDRQSFQLHWLATPKLIRRLTM